MATRNTSAHATNDDGRGVGGCLSWFWVFVGSASRPIWPHRPAGCTDGAAAGLLMLQCRPRYAPVPDPQQRVATGQDHIVRLFPEYRGQKALIQHVLVVVSEFQTSTFERPTRSAFPWNDVEETSQPRLTRLTRHEWWHRPAQTVAWPVPLDAVIGASHLAWRASNSAGKGGRSAGAGLVVLGRSPVGAALEFVQLPVDTQQLAAQSRPPVPPEFRKAGSHREATAPSPAGAG
jgi:hypothetical protein